MDSSKSSVLKTHEINCQELKIFVFPINQTFLSGYFDLKRMSSVRFNLTAKDGQTLTKVIFMNKNYF